MRDQASATPVALPFARIVPCELDDTAVDCGGEEPSPARGADVQRRTGRRFPCADGRRRQAG